MPTVLRVGRTVSSFTQEIVMNLPMSTSSEMTTSQNSGLTLFAYRAIGDFLVQSLGECRNFLAIAKKN